MSRRPPNGSKDDIKGEPARRKRCPSSKKESELQASLHSCKEQNRRLQIRTSCRRLCDLLPFVNSQLDTATTLELTARYTSYLKETLPLNILSKVNEAVEAKVSGLWKNKEKPQKKRRTVRLKRTTSQRAKPTAKKSTDEYVSRRYTEQKICKQVNQPSSTISNPLTMDQMLPPADVLTSVHPPPILLDKSSVPRGQMLPVCQDQFLSASFGCVENDWMNPASAFMNPTSCSFTSPVISSTFLPHMGLYPSSSHVFWDASPGLVDPVAPQSLNFGLAYSPPEQTIVTNFTIPPVEQSQIESPLVWSDGVLAVDFTSQPLVPFSVFQSATSSSDDLTCEAGNPPVLDTLWDPGVLQESDLCISSPLTDSPQDEVNPYWLDLLLDANGNLCFPDANLVNIVLSPYAGSN